MQQALEELGGEDLEGLTLRQYLLNTDLKKVRHVNCIQDGYLVDI